MTQLNVKADPRKPLKAIYAAVIAGLGTLATALADNEGISSLEGVALATSIVIAFGGVYFVENPVVAVEPPDGEPVEGAIVLDDSPEF